MANAWASHGSRNVGSPESSGMPGRLAAERTSGRFEVGFPRIDRDLERRIALCAPQFATLEPNRIKPLRVFAATGIRTAGHGTPCRSGRALAGAGVSASGWPAQYEIRVAGVLDDRWAAWFDGLQISGQGEETVICGLLADQPALHGLLTKLRDLGLCLISVRRLDTGEAETTHDDEA